MKRYFITGTDTDCGKTYSTCALLAYFKPKALALKPVASGCIITDKGLISEDALAIQKHCQLSLETINPWRFALPVSPHIAAKDNPLSIEAIADYCLNFDAKGAEFLFIEGAGGLMVPLTDTTFWIDVLRLSKLPVILTVGINHALLTQIALASLQIPFAGWIANEIDSKVLAWEENLTTLKNHLRAPLLGIIRHHQSFDALAINHL
jgi:dethiobiotin synthetase